jgi:hypothetical protein
MLVYNSYKCIYEDLQLQATLIHIVLIGSELVAASLAFFCLFRRTWVQRTVSDTRVEQSTRENH